MSRPATDLPHASGVTGPQIVRRLLRMVRELHAQGCESLYLDACMAPSGMYWRYGLAAMEDGRWPAVLATSRVVEGSLGGTDPSLPWARATDPAQVLAAKFTAAYPDITAHARRPNVAYAAWFREMESRTCPDGVPIFACDWGPNYEYCFLWGGTRDFRMPMPPGYRDRRE
jgi:hypothetical protein